jgi:HEPN domain-containing protein
MVFSEFIFEKVSAEHMYKPQMMKGLADESLRDFNPITLSSAFVTEKREDGAEKEFIDSYLEGAKILMHETYRRQDAKGIAKIYYNYSLVIPTVYLCRHCLELSIKRAIRLQGKSSKFTHGLERQWDAFRQYLPNERISGKERSLLKSMGEFIKNMDVLDDNGTKLRYPVQENKSFSQEKFMWANTRAIVENTESFVKQMELLVVNE